MDSFLLTSIISYQLSSLYLKVEEITAQCQIYIYTQHGIVASKVDQVGDIIDFWVCQICTNFEE